MVENDRKHSKMSKKVIFSSCTQEALDLKWRKKFVGLLFTSHGTIALMKKRTLAISVNFYTFAELPYAQQSVAINFNILAE